MKRSKFVTMWVEERRRKEGRREGEKGGIKYV